MLTHPKCLCYYGCRVRTYFGGKERITVKNIKTKKTKAGIIFPVLGLAALSAGVLVGPAVNTNAATSTGTSTVSVTVGAVIGIGVTNVNINMPSPAPTGSFATGTGTVSVATNDSTGYSVYLTSNSTTDTSLTHTNGTSTIASIGSIQTISGSTTMFGTMNTWGWSNNGTAFNPIVTKGTKSTTAKPTLYRKTNAASTTADNSTLTIGVTGDSTLTAGTYSGTLLLTAIPNSDSTNIALYE